MGNLYQQPGSQSEQPVVEVHVQQTKFFWGLLSIDTRGEKFSHHLFSWASFAQHFGFLFVSFFDRGSPLL